MENKENAFRYTYSAETRAEVESIRKKYLPTEATTLDRLRRLDRSASQKAQAWALTFGILGTLIMGTGMSLAMTDLASVLGMQTGMAMGIGIVIGILGMVLVALAYPMYNRVLSKERARIAPEILRLTDELMK